MGSVEEPKLFIFGSGSTFDPNFGPGCSSSIQVYIVRASISADFSLSVLGVKEFKPIYLSFLCRIRVYGVRVNVAFSFMSQSALLYVVRVNAAFGFTSFVLMSHSGMCRSG